ncbi:hypothetical protein CEXT_251831 [Caerostris extrusa]|uniref:Uncharacterized protein n=1 Tax=Caerostris extrusa TaxID=172846 RepID=A0AAV4WE66_CAEEX|nr:hypothetical protein CEXT_251831 [Caerostris extrusa]
MGKTLLGEGNDSFMAICLMKNVKTMLTWVMQQVPYVNLDLQRPFESGRCDLDRGGWSWGNHGNGSSLCEQSFEL